MTRLALLKSPYGGADTQGADSVLPLRRAIPRPAVRSLPSRILTIALVCASLYAALLGAGAFAQDEETAPAPAETAAPAQTEVPAAPPAAQTPEQTEPTPFPSPVETVVEATPQPTQTAEAPKADPTAQPTADAPAQAQAQTPAPAGTQAPATTPGQPKAGKAPKLGVDKVKRAGKDEQHPNRKQGTSREVCPRDGKLVGTVGMASTSPRGCVAPGKHGAGEHGGGDADLPFGGADSPAPAYTPSGVPTPANPGYSLATPGPAPIGVPNFFIEKFRIPPFLLPIYQAAGIQYGIRWEVLAAINEIETDYGRNLNISSAGALGWMQFMPSTWDMYGVDANGDGQKDPFNPVDAVFAAARYLRAAGADKDLYRAIFAYNHADWYVESVLMRARVIGGLPTDLVGSLTGLTQGRFPIGAKSTYAGQLPDSETGKRFVPGQNAAHVVESDGTRREIRIFSRQGAPVVAVNDGRITRLGHSRRLGNFVELQDSYGNTYRYSGLGRIAKTFPFPRERRARKGDLALPESGPAPKGPASRSTKSAVAKRHGGKPVAGKREKQAKRGAKHGAATRRSHAAAAKRRTKAPVKERISAKAELPAAAPPKERLFAHPARPGVRQVMRSIESAAAPSPGLSGETLTRDGQRLDPRDYVAKPLVRGARVTGGTVLGRLGRTSDTVAPNLRFEIRPAGRGAPRIDPKPILDGWKLLESTAIYRSAKRNPFFGADAEAPTIGQIMLMSKEALQRHVLHNPSIDIYGCGRQDVATGQIDRRVLAMLEFLASSGLKPTVTSLRCGHGVYTTSGNVSEHSTGTAVDIGAVNGIVISPSTQGKGSITDLTIQRLLTLQGTMKPHQIISLMTFAGTDNTFAMGDHDDHIHVGYRPQYGENTEAARRVAEVLKPDQWIKLIDRIGSIDNPVVREQPSRFSVAVTKRASGPHRGE